MFHRFHAHFVGKCLLAWQHMFALNVAVHHQDCGFVIVQIQHLRGDLLHAQLLAGFPAAVSADDLVQPVFLGAYQNRGDDAALPYAVHQLPHFQIVPDLERVVGKGSQSL